MENFSEKTQDINPVGMPDKYNFSPSTPLDQRNPGFFLWCDESREHWELQCVGNHEADDAYVYKGSIVADTITDLQRSDDDPEDSFNIIRSKNQDHLVFSGGVSNSYDGVSFTVTGDSIRFALYCDEWGTDMIYIGEASANPALPAFGFLLNISE